MEVTALKLLTYNVWFENHRWRERIPQLLKLIGAHDPDVICLQEVTKSFMTWLFARPSASWLRNYTCSDDREGRTLGSYGVLTLAKRHLSPEFHFFDFESRMGRRLLVTDVTFRGTTVGIGNVHLESLNNERLRVKQLAVSFRTLKKRSHSILCGDFNFSDDWPENKRLDSSYIDAWTTLHPDLKGSTMPSNVSFPAWRPDHVMLRKLKPETIEIVGDGAITGPACEQCEMHRRVCSPSDHFALVCTMSL